MIKFEKLYKGNGDDKQKKGNIIHFRNIVLCRIYDDYFDGTLAPQ